MTAAAATADRKTTVLLIDDQAIVGEAVRRMVATEPDIAFHYCKDPNAALETALKVEPTLILQDLVMPDIDGLELVRRFRADERTREVPMIVLSTKEEPAIKAEAFTLGANDYMVKFPDRLEVLARVRYHSKGYINLLERNEAFRALEANRKKLADEVAKAASYVRSLLPAPITDGPIRADWRFIPSADLGGDSFGYHDLDDDHFAFYLLDVCGHGVGAALLSVSAMNALRSQSLPQTDFRVPGQVLTALNRAFQMDQQNDQYFTIWYGVYNRPNRRLLYAGGGHPAALLLSGDPTTTRDSAQLDSNGLAIGMFPDLDYETLEHPVLPGSSLYFYSDGVYELVKPDDNMWSFEEFEHFMRTPEAADLDRVVAKSRTVQGSEEFVDDFSVVELRFA